MVNENLISFLEERIGSEVKNIRIRDEISQKDLYTPFKSKQIDKLPFIVTLDGQPFENLELVFDVASWDMNAIRIISLLSVPMQNPYPLPIGLSGTENIATFVPLIGPSEFFSRKKILERWVDFRFYGGPKDLLSNYLNSELDPTKLIKSLSARFQYQKGKLFTFLSSPATVSLIPADNNQGRLHITLNEYYKFNLKKDNFFPKFNLAKPLSVIQTILNKYQEFMENQIVPPNYPLDPYLSGLESFICKKCNSILYPNSVSKVNMYGVKFPGQTVNFNCFCPNCGEKQDVWSMYNDEKTFHYAKELFWSCPIDLNIYEVSKEKTKKGKKSYVLVCPECQKKMKKEITEKYHSALSRPSSFTLKNEIVKAESGGLKINYNL